MNQVRILFQGDSLTDGGRGRGENVDFNHYLGQSYVFAICARLGADFPGIDFDFINRGCGGDTLVDLSCRWQKDVLDLKPDILSVLIGVNDAGHEVRGWPCSLDLDGGGFTSLKEYGPRLRKLLVDARKENPALRIVLGVPFAYPGTMTGIKVTAWRENCHARGEIVKSIAMDFGASVVDYPAALDRVMMTGNVARWCWDGIHLTPTGHEIMAREWTSICQHWIAN